MTHVVVMGAGVVGMASAYLLARHGHRVTVVERHPEPGLETSFGNAGQLSYEYIAPLAGPGVLSNVPGWLLRKESPVRLKPSLDPLLWRWLAGFTAACNGYRQRAVLRRLIEVSLASRRLMQRYLEDHDPAGFQLRHSGKLILYSSPAALRAAGELAAFMNSIGGEQRVLDRAACLEKEPALRAYPFEIAGGLFLEHEQTADCHLFCRSLAQAAQALDCEILTRRRILAIRMHRDRVIALDTSQGEVRGDVFVCSLGNGARELLAPLGIGPLIYPLKGYSVTYPVVDPAVAPRVSVTDATRRVVYATLGNRLRIAGMADLDGPDLTADPRRIDTLHRLAATAFQSGIDHAGAEPWCGARPATPDGLPIIERSRSPNLILNLGHGHLGFTLALGSAERVAALIENDARIEDNSAGPAAMQPADRAARQGTPHL